MLACATGFLWACVAAFSYVKHVEAAGPWTRLCSIKSQEMTDWSVALLENDAHLKTTRCLDSESQFGSKTATHIISSPVKLSGQRSTGNIKFLRNPLESANLFFFFLISICIAHAILKKLPKLNLSLDSSPLFIPEVCV